MPDIFDLKNISPMLMAESRPFDSGEHIYELKLDGIRALAYLDGTGTELRNKRNKRLNDIYPELAGMHGSANRRCILDGELVLLREGKPDFFELQRRSLMSNSMRISLAAKQRPVQFVAFDILYSDNRQITDMQLLERKEMLASAVAESGSLAVSRFIEGSGVDFFNLAASQGLEGVVAKKKSSLYFIGRRTKDWVKFKVKQEADLVICGYAPGEDNGIRSLALGMYRDGRLIDQGSVAFGISGDVQKAILQFAEGHSCPCPFSQPFGSGDTVWITPKLVCSVEYMMRTEGGYMRQPAFKGLALDKTAEECIADW